MGRTTARLAAVLLILWIGGCTRYHAEASGISRRVEVVAYYRCQDPDCRTMDPAHCRVEIRVDGKRKWRISERSEGVENVYLAGGRIFVLLSKYEPEWRAVLGVVCENGELAEFWDLTSLVVIQDALIRKIRCESESAGAFNVDIQYYRTVSDGKVDSSDRHMTRTIKNLPCAPLVIKNDGPVATR